MLHSVLGIKLKNELKESKKKEQQWSTRSENMTCKEELENFPVSSSTKGKKNPNKNPHKNNKHPPKWTKPKQKTTPKLKEANNPQKNPKNHNTRKKRLKENTSTVSKHGVFLQEEKWLTLLGPLVMGWEVIYLSFKEFLGWTLGEVSECDRSEAPARFAEKTLKSPSQEIFSNGFKTPHLFIIISI